MRTFIKVLTTDTKKIEFNSSFYESFSYRDKIIHMVRQCIGMKYLKLVYGNDLWFLFKHYHKDLQLEIDFLNNKSKSMNLFGNDEESKILFSEGMNICINALSDVTISSPISIDIDNLSKFFIEVDHIPNFGSLTFAKTLYTHLQNCRDNSSKSFEGKCSILIPYNAMNSFSSWREIEGQSYDYDVKEMKVHADSIGIDINSISPFLKLLISIKNSIYQQSISSLLGLLSSFMIDPTYVNDYSGFITSFYSTGDPVKSPIESKVKKIYETNSIIFKGAYRVLFDEIDNSVFNYINNQCRCIVSMDKRIGFTTPIVNPLTAKNMFWILSYINKNFVDFFNDNKILTKFIAYFEPKITPDEITALLNAFYKMPNITKKDELILEKSNVGNIFSKGKSPFKLEEDAEKEEPDKKEEEKDTEEKDTQEEDSKEEDKTTPDNTEENTDENVDDSGTENDDTDQEEAPIDESEDPADDVDPPKAEEEVSEDQVLPEYLLKLDAPPDLNSVLYRHELDRAITCILKNPPKKMSNEVILILKNLQSHWLHIIALPQLKLIIKKLNQGV